MNTDTQPRRRARNALAALLSAALVVSAVGLVPTDPVSAVGGPGYDPGDPIPQYEPPRVGLDYRLEDRVGKWTGAWHSGDDAPGKAWPVNTYDPEYVFPTSFRAQFFNQCVDQKDWAAEILDGTDTVNTYRWTFADNHVVENRTCYFTFLDFPGEGVFPVQLEVIDPDGKVIVEKSRSVRVKDHLIVVLGDSMASGEGAPDVELNPAKDTWGGWVDRRCHRSANAAGPRVARMLEDADPYSTVTFLSFACSGATLFDVDPDAGQGVLGPYDGIEGYEAGSRLYLPAQVDQLQTALTSTRRGEFPSPTPERVVDKLFVSGGINDVRFSTLALDCVLFSDCPNSTGAAGIVDGTAPQVKQWYADQVAKVPGYYTMLKDALQVRGIEYGEGLAMQYPNPLTDSNGNLCKSMLDDVLPPSAVWKILAVLTFPVFSPVLLAALPLLIGPPFTFLPILGRAMFTGLKWDADEIKWLSTRAMPWLDDAVRQGADNADFTFVDGIANSFVKHGYCATDNWLVRAPESSKTQGPWDVLSDVIGAHNRTTGTIHPNSKGYTAAAKVLFPHVADLINVGPTAMNDLYNADKDTTLTVPPAGVLLNDTDPNGDPLTAKLRTPPANGTVELSPNGGFVYKPNPGHVGEDSFTYWASDGGGTSIARVAVWTYDPNPPDPEIDWDWTIPEVRPPVAIGGTASTFPICQNCGDKFEYQPVVITPPKYGRVDIRYEERVTGVIAVYQVRDLSMIEGLTFPLIDSFVVEMRYGDTVVGTQTFEVEILEPRVAP